jgi:RHS repeat-associated protein
VDQDGNLLIADSFNSRVLSLTFPLPGFSGTDIPVLSQDGGEIYHFNGFGQHLETLDALTGVTRYRFAYNTLGLLITITDGSGNVTMIERDANGTPTAIVAPHGQRTALTVDANGFLDSVTNPANEADLLGYTADGLLTSLTDPRGGVHSFSYDALGRLQQDTDPAGGFSALSRVDGTNNYTVSLTTALGRTSTYLVENLATGDLRLVDTDPSGHQTVEQIGTNGTRTTAVPDGTVTTIVHGPDPRFGMQAPLASSLTVDTPGGLSSTTMTSRTVALADPVNPLSLLTQMDTININGRTYTSAFDAAQSRITTTTPAGRQTVSQIDSQARVTSEQVTGLDPLAYSYDAQGRLTTISQGTGPSTRTTTLAYNAEGYLDSITDPLSRSVSFAYDSAGRVLQQTLPDGRVINYTYDGNGNVTSVTPPGRPPHGFAYTPVDLEDTYTPPDIGIGVTATQYAYNLDKQLTQVTRPDGQTIGLGYDAGGRLNTVTTPGGTVQYAYNPTTGNLSTVTGTDGGTLSYTHDGSLLTSTTWAGTVAGSVGGTYDNNFRVTSQTVNGANPISFGYDIDGLLNAAGSLSISRSPQNGLITGTTLSSVTDSRSYTSFGELDHYTANVSGSPVLDVQYTRDNLGRITQKVETINGVTDTYLYVYDTAGRLTDVTKNSVLIAHYSYDLNGNRLSVATPSGTVSGTFDAQDRMLSYGTNTYTYTANGELLTKTDTATSEVTQYTYNVLGNLTSVMLPNGDQIEYVIDGQNRRIGKKINGTLVKAFLYQDQLNPVAELDGAGSVVARFVYGSQSNLPDYVIKGGVTYRIVSDHLGSPRLVVNTSTNTVVQQIDYDEFGNVALDTNPGFQPFGFAGGLYDRDTGLTRFGARDYDAETGTWILKDPIRFGGMATNLYGYGLNDPINSVDPTGLLTLDDIPNIPPSVVDFSAGLGDALLLGFGDDLRAALGIGGVNRCSAAYRFGGYASLAGGLTRLGYAGAAKAISLAPGISGVEAVAARNTLKTVARGGLFPGYRNYSYGQLLEQYGTDAAVKAAAGRTNTGLNLGGAAAAGGSLANGRECRCPE